jgi:hypothetical protein
VTPRAIATIGFIGANLAVVFAADRAGTPGRRLVRFVGVGAAVTVILPVAIVSFWAFTADGNGWFAPLLAAAVLAVALAAVRSKRGYAVAVIVGTVNASLAAFIVLASAMSQWD